MPHGGHGYHSSQGDMSSPRPAHDVVYGDVKFFGYFGYDEMMRSFGGHGFSSHCFASCSGFQSAMDATVLPSPMQWMKVHPGS